MITAGSMQSILQEPGGRLQEVLLMTMPLISTAWARMLISIYAIAGYTGSASGAYGTDVKKN